MLSSATSLSYSTNSLHHQGVAGPISQMGKLSLRGPHHVSRLESSGRAGNRARTRHHVASPGPSSPRRVAVNSSMQAPGNGLSREAWHTFFYFSGRVCCLPHKVSFSCPRIFYILCLFPQNVASCAQENFTQRHLCVSPTFKYGLTSPQRPSWWLLAWPG